MEDPIATETIKKTSKPKNPLNNSAFRYFAMKGGYIKMVSPSAIDIMQQYLDKFLLRPIIKDMTTIDKLYEGSSKKACRIVQVEKLRDIIQNHVSHDVSHSINIDEYLVEPRKNEKDTNEYAIHQLTFRKHINNLTEELFKRKNIQWSSKCLDMLQKIIEHELTIVMSTCGRVIWINSGQNTKKKLKLTPKDVRFVFESRYSRR